MKFEFHFQSTCKIAKKFVFFTAVLLAFCAQGFMQPSSVYAAMKAQSMGQIYSVMPEGPFDSSRNPALLAFQKESNAIGIFLKGMVFSHADDTGTFEYYESNGSEWEYGEGDLSGDTDRKEFSGMLAYSVKVGKSVIGFSLSENDDSQYNSTDTELMLSGIFSNSQGGSESMEFIIPNEEESYNPAIFTSIGIPLSNTSSFGIQFKLGYTRKVEIEEEEEEGYFNELEYETQEFSGSLGVGYLLKKKDNQLGIGINFGEYSVIKSNYSYTFTDTDDKSGSFSDDSTEVSGDHTAKGKYTKGIKIVAGGYKRVSSSVALAFEGEYHFRNVVSGKKLNDEHYEEGTGDDSVAIIKGQETVTSEDVIVIRGGIEINQSSSLSYMGGLAYTRMSAMSVLETESELTTDITIEEVDATVDIFLLSLGTEYKVSSNMSVNLTSLINYSKSDYTVMEYPDDKESSDYVEIKRIVKLTTVFIMLGAVYTF